MEETHEEWTPYQRMEASILKDISHDTDTILDKMEDMNMGSGFDSGMLTGLMANKGIDPGIVAMLNDRCRDGNWGWGDGGMLTLLFLIILLGGRGGFSYGTDAGVAGVDRTVVNEANYTRLLDAVGGQGARQEAAIQALANALNCDVQAIQGALCGIDKQLAVNQGSIINAIQSCCCNIQSKIDSCCCQTNMNIERTGNAIQQKLQENNFAMSNFFAAQTQLIQQKFCDQNAYLADQFCQIKMREDAREIQALRDKVAEQRETANTALILNAIANKDTINYTGTIDGTTVTGTGSLS